MARDAAEAVGVAGARVAVRWLVEHRADTAAVARSKTDSPIAAAPVLSQVTFTRILANAFADLVVRGATFHHVVDGNSVRVAKRNSKGGGRRISKSGNTN